MGKQRTPQGRSPGRRGPPAAPIGATTTPIAVEAAAPEESFHTAEDSLAAMMPEPTPEPLHAHLLDTVSPEALGTAAPTDEPHAAPAETPVPADANLADANAAGAASSEPELLAVSAADRAPEAAHATPDPDPAPAAAPVPEAPEAYTNVVPLKAATPARPPLAQTAETGDAPVQLSDGALPSPASWRAGHRPVPPLRRDLEGMGETLFAFMRNESTAVITHLNALRDARSPADAIRLQVNEIQRAADASLTCWSEIARRASRIVAQR